MKKIILGSDWWTDCDDAMAIRLLCNCHKAGKVNFLGLVLSACMEDSLCSADAFMRRSGLEIPIGLDRSATGFGGVPSYQHNLATRYPSRFKSNLEAEDPVRLYRRILAENDSVEILEIGYPQVLAALVASPADDISPLNGAELICAKVPRLWIMAGKWNEQGGRENNFCRNSTASRAAAELCEKWPSPITFLGWEVGYSVISGSKLPEDDPLKQVLADHGSPNGRCSWDPMLCLMAVIGNPKEAGYSTVRGTALVKAEDGSNYFTASPAGQHEYVVKDKPDEFYAAAVDAWL